jgi:hypothetical protein
MPIAQVRHFRRDAPEEILGVFYPLLNRRISISPGRISINLGSVENRIATCEEEAANC